jgi:hypothetical protein
MHFSILYHYKAAAPPGSLISARGSALIIHQLTAVIAHYKRDAVAELLAHHSLISTQRTLTGGTRQGRANGELSYLATSSGWRWRNKVMIASSTTRSVESSSRISRTNCSVGMLSLAAYFS